VTNGKVTCTGSYNVAAMAFEDAYVLSRELERSPEDLARALRAYEAERAPRTAKAQIAARKQAKVFHLTSPYRDSNAGCKIALMCRTEAGWQNSKRSGCIAMIHGAASRPSNRIRPNGPNCELFFCS
jgi:hypothetical protein